MIDRSRALTTLGVAALLAGCSGKNTDAPAATATTRQDSGVALTAAQRERIHVQPVSMTVFRPTIETTGTVAFDGDLSTQVLAPISGPVSRIVVQPGSYVRTGDPLAYVSSPDFATAVADYRKAQAAATQAQRVAELDEKLFQNDALARRELEQAQVDAQAAAADRDAAMQALRALGVSDANLDAIRSGRPVDNAQAVIRAPIEGTVVEKLINPGQLLQAGSTPSFTIANLSTMWVMGNVFESDLASVTKGDPVEITTAAAPDTMHGTVDYVAALVDPNTRATSVRIVVGNTKRYLKRDMFVNVAIRSRRDVRGILAPASSVLRDEDNLPYVYVQTPEGGYARRQVKLGTRVGDHYQILGGLSDGDHVVAEGGLFLQFAATQ